MKAARLFFMLMVLSVSLGLNLVSADSDLFDNLNGNGYILFNFTNITGTYGSMNISWGNLTNFPLSCPAGTAITALGQAVTCTAIGNSSFNQTLTDGLYVPYSGAINNIDILPYNITVNKLIVNGSLVSIGNFTASKGSTAIGLVNDINTATVESTGAGSFISIGSTSTARNNTVLASGTGAFLVGGISNVNSSLRAIGTGSVVMGSATSRNSRIYSTNSGSIAFGAVITGDNTSIRSTGTGSFAQGLVSAPASSILSTGTGSFASGAATGSTVYIGANITASAAGAFAHGWSNSINTTITARGVGSFAQGAIDNKNYHYIDASGIGSVAIGLPNISVSGIGSVAMGQNLDVIGNNTFAFGASDTMQQIIASRTFWVGTNVNSTGNYSAQGIPGVSGSFTCGSSPNVTITGGIITAWAC